MQFWLKASLSVVCIRQFVHSQHILLLSIFYRESFDMVCIVEVKDAYVTMAPVGDSWEDSLLADGNETLTADRCQ